MPDQREEREEQSKKEEHERVRDLANAVSTQARVANRAWIALVTVAVYSMLQHPLTENCNMSLPFGLGEARPILFHEVVYSLLIVLAIAFSAAHGQQIRGQRLAHNYIDSILSDRAAELREFFDLWRMPSLNRVAPLAQSLPDLFRPLVSLIRRSLPTKGSRPPTLLRVVKVVYYLPLKLASLFVYFGLPGWALWHEFWNISPCSSLRYLLKAGGILGGSAVALVFLLDILYMCKVIRHIWCEADSS